MPAPLSMHSGRRKRNDFDVKLKKLKGSDKFRFEIVNAEPKKLRIMLILKFNNLQTDRQMALTTPGSSASVIM